MVFMAIGFIVDATFIDFTANIKAELIIDGSTYFLSVTLHCF